jgi:hypothetical protein
LHYFPFLSNNSFPTKALQINVPCLRGKIPTTGRQTKQISTAQGLHCLHQRLFSPIVQIVAIYIIIFVVIVSSESQHCWVFLLKRGRNQEQTVIRHHHLPQFVIPF